MWHRSGAPEHRRLARFFGTLLVINIAIGVVTGLVQEFEFGMNWSAYSRYVGDVFGAPLAMEGLAAFFLESTFLGLWLFGWDRLPKRIHLACIWLVALGASLSAAFIMAANSWMQHPVGYTINPEHAAARAERHRGGVHQPHLRVGLLPRAPGLAPHRLPPHARGLGLAPPARQQRARLRAHGQAGAGGPRPGVAARPRGREPARDHGDDLPAHEDRRGRGTVGDLPAVLVLALPGRRRPARRGSDEGHRHPAPALRAGHGHVGRRGRRPERAAVPVRAAVRPGRATSPTSSCSTGRCA